MWGKSFIDLKVCKQEEIKHSLEVKARIEEAEKQMDETEKKRDKELGLIGNLVYHDVPIA